MYSSKKKYYPPKFAQWLLSKILTDYNRWAILGDLEEEFYQILEENGIKQARWFYIKYLIRTIPFGVIHYAYWGIVMLRNYIKIAVRNLLRQKGYSFINIFGLAAGLVCALFVMLWVLDEISYDQFHTKAENLYRVTYSELINGEFIHYAMAPFPSVKAFSEEIPGVIDYARLITMGESLVKWKNKKFEENGIYYVDPGFLKMFSFRLLKGEFNSVLSEPGKVVITESIENKIFGNQNSLGEILTLSNGKELKITGVIQDPPKQSHLEFDYLISISTIEEDIKNQLESWLSISGWCYVELSNKANVKDIEIQMVATSDKYTGESLTEYGTKVGYYLQPIRDIHLKSDLNSELDVNGNIKYVYIFSFVALFVLIIACINFVNLSTARAAVRAKEVGLRKVIGAHRKKIITQFFTESFLVTIVSLLLALVIIWSVLPLFNEIVGKEFSYTDFYRLEFFEGVFIVVFLTSLLAGAYPSFYISHFEPALILKGSTTCGRDNSYLRKSLVVFQFTVSIILIAATLIITSQVNYLKTKRLGLNNEQILILKLTEKKNKRNYRALCDELLKNPNIKSVSNSTGIPGDVGITLTVVKEDADESINYNSQVILCDYDFLDTYGIRVIEGRNFSKDFGADTLGAVIINKVAAERYGWGRNAVGKHIGFSKENLRPIVGIVESFNYASLKYAVEPLVLLLDVRGRQYLSIKLNSSQIDETLDFIKSKWSEFQPERSISYFFADEYFNSLYKNEERVENIVVSFSYLAIVIACLGLVGLSAYSALRRKKEIGVRKVLGAGIFSVITMLLKEYLSLIIIGGAIGLLLVYYYFENYWLTDFYNRIIIGPIIIIVPFIIVLILALVTSGYQAVRAALSNPVDSLRNE